MMTKFAKLNTGSIRLSPPRGSAGKLSLFILYSLILFGLTDTAGATQRGVFPADMPKSYRTECTGCHVAYAPDLLPAETWQRIMRGLDKHYGVDAATDSRESEEIERFLVRNAGNELRPMKNGDPLRLTDTLWFHRRHGMVKAFFQTSQVKSKANCTACHVHADDGRYDEYTPLVRNYVQEVNKSARHPARAPNP